MKRKSKESTHVLVVDDHSSARQCVAEIMLSMGHRVTAMSSAVEALAFLAENTVDLVFTDLMMPGMDGLEFITTLNARRIKTQVVMFTAHASVDTAVRAMKMGAFDYIEKPFSLEQLEDVTSRALRQQKASLPPVTISDSAADWQMVGQSLAMKKLRERIMQVAVTDETVLITGESGTGKELVARAIHNFSQRSKKPWVAVNCPALSPQLMESEWFGHEKGAFTNADEKRVGRFEAAEGGTLLLDEVTEIEIGLQAKLLRVLQERCFERVGSNQTRQLNVRVVASTNRDLYAEIKKGTFREDLFYRLNVIPVSLPPLRDRRDDVVLLARHFLQRTAQRIGSDVIQLDPVSEELLEAYQWPGNVRELENLMTRLSVLAQNGRVDVDLIRSWMNAGGETASSKPEVTSAEPSTIAFAGKIRMGVSLQEMERELIEATLEQFEGHREKTAQALGIGVRTLTNKLRAYGYAPREKSFQKAA